MTTSLFIIEFILVFTLSLLCSNSIIHFIFNFIVNILLATLAISLGNRASNIKGKYSLGIKTLSEFEITTLFLHWLTLVFSINLPNIIF